MRHDPHLLVEGCLIAGFAMGAHTCFIYIRGEFVRERERLQAAVDQAYAANLIGKNNVHGFPFDIVVHHGAGAYICGEETALLQSLEGRRFRPMSASTAARPRSTTWNRSRWCRTLRGVAPPGLPASGGRTIPAPSCSAFPATWRNPAPSRTRWECHCGSCSTPIAAACAAAGTTCSPSFPAAPRCR